MRISVAAAADVVAIGIFAAVGRASHAEGVSLLGVVSTAWPFVAGWAAGAILARAWRHPERLSTGLVIWPCTVAGGMILRLISGNTVQPAFLVVASITLGVLLLGWRGIYALLDRARTRRTTTARVP